MFFLSITYTIIGHHFFVHRYCLNNLLLFYYGVINCSHCAQHRFKQLVWNFPKLRSLHLFCKIKKSYTCICMNFCHFPVKKMNIWPFLLNLFWWSRSRNWWSSLSINIVTQVCLVNFRISHHTLCLQYFISCKYPDSINMAKQRPSVTDSADRAKHLCRAKRSSLSREEKMRRNQWNELGIHWPVLVLIVGIRVQARGRCHVKILIPLRVYSLMADCHANIISLSAGYILIPHSLQE